MINILKNIFIYIKFKIFYFLENISFQFPLDSEKKVLNFINIAKKYSMSGSRRMYFLSQCIEYVHKKSLPGDFVECGVWKGGNIILMSYLNEYYNLNKKIFGFDTFDGMSEPFLNDKTFYGLRASNIMRYTVKSKNKSSVWAYSPIEDVKRNLAKHTNFENIKLIKGKVEKTLLEEKNLPKQISILRLDTDFYDSTKTELNILYPRLVTGGFLIIDDYGHWQGAREAVDEYFQNNYEFMYDIDYTCRVIVKSS